MKAVVTNEIGFSFEGIVKIGMERIESFQLKLTFQKKVKNFISRPFEMLELIPKFKKYFFRSDLKILQMV